MMQAAPDTLKFPVKFCINMLYAEKMSNRDADRRKALLIVGAQLRSLCGN